MDFFSIEFFSALAAIVVIDLVLAGDNAIVIALAARNLPVRLRKRAIIWGTAGAIVVRSAMTLVVVWLLNIPGLLLAGGAMLIWIAYHLLAPQESSGEDHAPVATTFLGAMKTIVIADAVMGLDNVLAVAGAAHGSYVLVVLGLLISIPIVIWGSTLILNLVDRFPAIVYIGAGVLAWTAVKMMLSEPLIKDVVAAANGTTTVLVYLIVIGGVLWAGFVRNHRQLESRIHARLVTLRQSRNSLTASADDAASANAAGAVGAAAVAAVAAVGASVAAAAAGAASADPLLLQSNRSGRPAGSIPLTQFNPSHSEATGDTTMKRILIPVDGSPNAQFAVRHVVNEFMQDSAMEIHLLNVQPWFSRHVARFFNAKDLKAWHQERADEALAPARRLLEQHGIPHTADHKMGERAKTIADEARRLRCHHIVMSTARKNSLTRMLEDSTTNKVLELTSVPVELISGDAASRLERWGVPTAGIGALLALIVAAVD